MDELREIERFAGEDADTAADAYSRLRPSMERFLRVVVSDMLPSEEDRDDAIAESLRKIWQARASYRVKGIRAWWGFVATVGRRCALDLLGAPRHDPLPDDVPDEPWVRGEPAYRRADLYRAADELWLGVDPQLSEPDRRERLLAAQLFFLHGLGWSETASMLGRDEPLSRATLDAWLSEWPTLLDLAYSALYVDRWRLVGSLLAERSLSPDEARQWFVMAEGNPKVAAPNGLPAWAVSVTTLRFGYGMLDEKILRRFPNVDGARFVPTSHGAWIVYHTHPLRPWYAIASL